MPKNETKEDRKAKSIERFAVGLSFLLSAVAVIVITYEVIVSMMYLVTLVVGKVDVDSGFAYGYMGIIMLAPLAAMLLNVILNLFAAHFISRIVYTEKGSLPIIRRFLGYTWMQIVLLIYIILLTLWPQMEQNGRVDILLILSILNIPFTIIGYYLLFAIKIKSNKKRELLLRIMRGFFVVVDVLFIIGVLWGCVQGWKI